MRILFSLFLVITVFSCTQKPKESTIFTQNLPDLPPIDGESAMKLVEKQIAFGPRTLNSKAAKDCAWFISDFAENLSYKVNYLVEIKLSK